MARKRLCDRCRAEINNDDGRFRRLWTINADDLTEEGDVEGKYDLCDECDEAFDSWMENNSITDK